MQINRLFLGAGITGLLNLAALTIVSPSYALSTDFTTWSTIGSVTSTTSTATIESGTGATALTGGGPGSLEAFLNIDPTNTPLTPPNPSNYAGAVDGSAIATTTSANAGDVFSFNWSFSTSDTNNTDAAFVTIGDNNNTSNYSVIFLTGITPSASSPFTYTFTSTGNYTVGIGVVDVGDGSGVSTLTASNPNFQTIPWDVSGGAAIPAVGGILTLGLLRKFKQVF